MLNADSPQPDGYTPARDVRHVSFAAWATDRALRVSYARASAVGVFEIDPRRAVGKTLQDVFGISRTTDDLVAHHQAAIDGEPRAFRWWVQERCFEVEIEPIRHDDDGEIIGCAAIAVEVTDRLCAERELADTRQRFEEAQAVAHVGSFAWDIATNTVRWSNELQRIYGVEKTGFAGTYEAFLSFVHPDDRAHIVDAVASALRDRRPFEYEHRIVVPGGGIRNLHTRGDVILDEHGQPIRMVGSCWDTTSLVDTKVRLESSLSLLETTLDASADGLLVVDLDGKVTAYNQTFLTLWRIPPDIAAKRDDAELLATVLDQVDEPEQFLRQVQVLYGAPEQKSYDVVTFKDGRVFERYSAPQRLAGRIVGRVWSFRDVTERTRAERQAREAINILAIAAHDVRNPLGGLELQLDVMRNAIASGAPTPQALGEQIRTCKRFVTRASSLLSGLLDVTQIGAGKLALHLEAVDLVRLTRDVVARAQVEIAAARCDVVITADTAVEGRWDLSRIDQIITNLLSNAIKYGRGKPIEIDVRTDAGGCRWAIRDHGIGISIEYQRRIFNQFERGVVEGQKGAGLGLWIVRQLVAALGGRVDVESQVGEGSTFTLTLPYSSPG